MIGTNRQCSRAVDAYASVSDHGHCRHASTYRTSIAKESNQLCKHGRYISERFRIQLRHTHTEPPRPSGGPENCFLPTLACVNLLRERVKIQNRKKKTAAEGNNKCSVGDVTSSVCYSEERRTWNEIHFENKQLKRGKSFRGVCEKCIRLQLSFLRRSSWRDFAIIGLVRLGFQN